mgnify:CR=1 FL=1
MRLAHLFFGKNHFCKIGFSLLFHASPDVAVHDLKQQGNANEGGDLVLLQILLDVAQTVAEHIGGAGAKEVGQSHGTKRVVQG